MQLSSVFSAKFSIINETALNAHLMLDLQLCAGIVNVTRCMVFFSGILGNELWKGAKVDKRVQHSLNRIVGGLYVLRICISWKITFPHLLVL